MYRTAFLPALVALFVAAFALEDRPEPARNPLPADAFDGARAFGSGQSPAPQSLTGLAQAFPDRTPGSVDDDRMAEFVAQSLRSPEAAGERVDFTVRKEVAPSRNGDVVTVVAQRPGASDRRIVVLANRDGPGLANLSGTAALIELARVLKARDTRKTLVLVSTSGSTTGDAGARHWAREQAGAPVDAVIVLGDMAGTRVRKPWVVGWPQSTAPTPLGLERTVQAAVRREVHGDAGGPRALAQWIRRAVPVTVSGQGAIGGEGLPAILLSESGELGPAADEPVLPARLNAFGRAALSAVSAVDAAGPRTAPAFANASEGIVTLRNVLPDWASRLVVGTLLLPALLAALDAFFRARRRRVPVTPWLIWLGVASLPLPVAWLWLRALAATGMVKAPDGPVLPGLFPLQTSGIVAMVSALVAGGLVCWIVRWLAPKGRSAEGVDGLAVALAVWLSVLGAVAWVLNPFAAGILLLATHLWLFGWRPRAALAVGLAGLLPLLVVAVYYGFALDLGPLGLAWGSALGAMSGSGLWTALLLAAALAALTGVARAAAARRRLEREGGGAAPFRTRGPLSYAGPGSLGGTESALRR